MSSLSTSTSNRTTIPHTRYPRRTSKIHENISKFGGGSTFYDIWQYLPLCYVDSNINNKWSTRSPANWLPPTNVVRQYIQEQFDRIISNIVFICHGWIELNKSIMTGNDAPPNLSLRLLSNGWLINKERSHVKQWKLFETGVLVSVCVCVGVWIENQRRSAAMPVSRQPVVTAFMADPRLVVNIPLNVVETASKRRTKVENDIIWNINNSQSDI